MKVELILSKNKEAIKIQKTFFEFNASSILGFFRVDFRFFLRGLYQVSYTTSAKRIENRPKEPQNRLKIKSKEVLKVKNVFTDVNWRLRI